MKILVIEDEPASRRLVAATLARGGHVAVEAADGVTGLRLLFDERPAVVVLAWDLSGIDGFEVLVRVRQLSAVPVLVVSGRADELEAVRALNAGADDYVTRPFGLQELLARVNALARRAEATTVAAVYDDGVLLIDPAQGEARAGDRPLGLTPLELRLLWTFASQPGRTLGTQQLLRLVWNGESHATERVKVYVGYLRVKLAAAGLEGVIVTVRGFGYRFQPPERPAVAATTGS